MSYTIQYLDEDGGTIKSVTHKGPAESASKAARNGMFDHQADSARIIDEAGQEVDTVRVDA
jgi:hypothetical protein